VAARHDQIGDENLRGLAVLVQHRRPHLDQPLVRARLFDPLSLSLVPGFAGPI
jgi:hypothetical protein